MEVQDEECKRKLICSYINSIYEKISYLRNDVRHPTVRLYQNTKIYEGKLKMYRNDLHRLPSLSFLIFCTSVQTTDGRE